MKKPFNYVNFSFTLYTELANTQLRKFQSEYKLGLSKSSYRSSF